MNAPPEPTNVRLALPDGPEVPCDLLYDGEIDGIHHWVAVPRVAVELAAGVSLRIGTLPGLCAVGIAFAEIDP